MSNRLLKQYLRLKGFDYSYLAQQAGCHFTNIEKVVNGRTYLTKSGPKVRRSPLVENTIANCLQMPHEQVWGPEAHIYLKKAIKKELWKQFLTNNNVTQAGA